MRILIVEDEPKLAAYLQRGLRENGYTVDVAASGIDGLHLAREGSHDLLLLDVMLPGMDGFELLRALRHTHATRALPVLMLSARDRVEDRVRGLQDGADDYLGKPFAFSELLARMQALLRRGAGRGVEESAVLRLADLEIDLLRRRAHRGAARLELTAKEFNLLTLLLRRQGQVLSRTLLAEQVWDMNFDSDTNLVEVAVRRLRAKLDDPFPHKLLHTVRGMGYVLEDRSAEPSAASATATPAAGAARDGAA
ncbi:MAG: heavy metal response regulator transcription factor [Xylophilus ampelinus]